MENIVASAKRLGGKAFEDIELSGVAELLGSHPQKIVEKVDKRGQRRLTCGTQSMLK